MLGGGRKKATHAGEHEVAENNRSHDPQSTTIGDAGEGESNMDGLLTAAREELRRAYAQLDAAIGDYVDVAIYRVRAAELHCQALRAEESGEPFPLRRLPWLADGRKTSVENGRGIAVKSDRSPKACVLAQNMPTVTQLIAKAEEVGNVRARHAKVRELLTVAFGSPSISDLHEDQREDFLEALEKLGASLELEAAK